MMGGLGKEIDKSSQQLIVVSHVIDEVQGIAIGGRRLDLVFQG